jgi:polar amino acid transport system substrate-binding protein
MPVYLTQPQPRFHVLEEQAMRNFLRRTSFLLFVAGAVSLVLLTACAGTHDGAQPADAGPVAASSSELRIGVSPTAAPLVYRQAGQLVGVEIDLARQLADFLGKTPRFIELAWKDQIPALLDGRIDIIMSGMSITKARQVRIAFSNPYFRTGQMAIIRKADKLKYRDGFYALLTQSLTTRFGVVKETTGQYFVQRNFGRAKAITAFPDAAKAVAALISGDVDVVIYDAPMVLMLAAENQGRGVMPLPSLLTEEYLAWGMRKNDEKLLMSANDFLVRIQTDGRLDRILHRWIPF